MRHCKSALILSVLFFIPHAFSAENVVLQNKGEGSPNAVNAQLKVQQGLNRLEVDDKKSARNHSASFGAKATYHAKNVYLGMDVTSLEREESDFKQRTDIIKRTQTYTPALGWLPASGLGFLVDYQVITTDAKRETSTKTYGLDSRRFGSEIRLTSADQVLALRYDSEARAEQEYNLAFFPVALVDRDYVPAQATLSWQRKVLPSLSLNALMRYSHYNNDVYKDQYDTEAPKHPTMAQVLDYLLSFQVGAEYAMSSRWSLAAQLLRKAALDVNSYNNDAYVVAHTASADLNYKVSERASLGVGTDQSSGQKDHEVQGQTYRYASRVERYRGGASIHF